MKSERMISRQLVQQAVANECRASGRFREIFRYLVVVVIASSFGCFGGISAGFADSSGTEISQGIRWESWGDSIFQKAKAEKKLVLLNLKAEWCHWCHVMEAETYSVKQVQDVLRANYIAVAEQQDANPALSAQYREYGWPATIIFSSSGKELKVLSGYVEAKEFAEQLTRLVTSPEDSVRTPQKGKLNAETGEDALLQLLKERYRDSLDLVKGGLKTSHRFLDPDSIEYALRQSLRGEHLDRDWLLVTLAANQSLQDPIWGGFFQYSTRRDWNYPHFEKLLTSQVVNIKSYLGAYSALGKPDGAGLLAEATQRYIDSFLRSGDGSFYVSHSADIAGVKNNREYFALSNDARRSIGLPKVDTHEYAKEAGLGMEAVLALYASTGAEHYLIDAKNVGEWLLANRIMADGAVVREKRSVSLDTLPVSVEDHFLADAIPVARSFLKMAAITGERKWLNHGVQVLSFCERAFSRDGIGGYVSSDAASAESREVKDILQRSNFAENVALARVANLYYYFSGRVDLREMANRAYKSVLDGDAALSSISEPGPLLAHEELTREPIHITVIGARGDATTEALWREAIKVPDFFVVTERFTREELDVGKDVGEELAAGVKFPRLAKPAAFLCANKTCSLPMFSPGELHGRIFEVLKGSKKL